jgi:hypothetical protein
MKGCVNAWMLEDEWMNESLKEQMDEQTDKRMTE